MKNTEFVIKQILENKRKPAEQRLAEIEKALDGDVTENDVLGGKPHNGHIAELAD